MHAVNHALATLHRFRIETASIISSTPAEKETRMAAKKEAKQESATKDKPQPTEDEIRKRAHEIYCARDDGPGSEMDDWLKAETELKEGHATAG